MPAILKSCAVMAAAAASKITTVAHPRCWILDSGAGSPLVSKEEDSAVDLEAAIEMSIPQVLDTAGGDITVTHTLPVYSPAMRTTINAYLLGSTPAVVSLGIMCAKKGY